MLVQLPLTEHFKSGGDAHLINVLCVSQLVLTLLHAVRLPVLCDHTLLGLLNVAMVIMLRFSEVFGIASSYCNKT